MKTSSKVLAGTATLAALTIVLDYAVKYSNFKIAFPWLLYLKFDLTGIPIVLSALLFGLVPGTLTSTVAAIGILARSGDAVGSSMKGLAEFSTVLGLAIGMRLPQRFKTVGSSAVSIVSRVLIMIAASSGLVYVGIMPFDQTYVNVPLVWGLLIGAFNVLQGAISVIGGYYLYNVIRESAPSLVSRIRSD